MGEAASVATNLGVARLRTIILVDAATAVAATVFIVVIRLTVVSSPYLTLVAVCVALSAAVMAGGVRPLERGDVRHALRWLAVANWIIAIVAATIATFCWPLMMLTALLPSVLAASLITGRELAFYVLTSVVVSLAVVLVGLLQDFSGLSEDVPRWVRDAVLIVFAPSLVGLVALMVLQSSVRMQGALDTLTASRAEIAAQADELRRSRARVVAATDRERRRIERDLHDGAQQRLIGIGIGLSRAKAMCGVDPPAAATLLDSLRHELRVAHDELRNLAQGVYPPVLTEHGLEAALQSAADRCPLPVTVALDQVGRHHPDVEAALFFCCVEALQNAVKHAQARSIRLECGLDESTLWISVADDGVGFDSATSQGGRGLVNIRDRLGAIGGSLEVTSKHDAGVVVRGHVPVGVHGADAHQTEWRSVGNPGGRATGQPGSVTAAQQSWSDA
jgi:signal transduction histidine kinase